MVVVFGIAAFAVLVGVALVVWGWFEGDPRSEGWRGHEDGMMDTIQELRIRRNLNQGG